MRKASREELINAAKRADKKTDGPLSQNDFIRITGYREWQIENLFSDGGWSELQRLAKIETKPKRPKKLSGKKTIGKKKSVAKKNTTTKVKAIAKKDIIAQEEPIAPEATTDKTDAIANKESNELKTAAVKEDAIIQEESIDPEKAITEFDKLDLKDIKSNPKTMQHPSSPSVQSKKEMEERIQMEIAEFGELLDFRGLRHAPINENGVIYLFGMVSHEIGFMVEAVHAAFPDCEAKRHIGNNRYQRVRIKFEYKSSNYKSQGYDSAGADMIVCWLHDWPDCPLEVLDLKSAIGKLKK